MARRVAGSLLLALGALLVASLVGTAAAGLPNYGDFVGTNVTFKSVEETTQTTDPPVLFGAPTVAGNQLTFTPTGFIATATGGASDLTSSILTTTIVGNSPTDTIDVIIIEELGNVTLTGPGGAPTNASASIGGFATVLATTAGPTFSVIPFSGIFSPADTFSLPGDAGTQLWSGTAVIDIAAVVPNATNVVLQYDDTLDANSEASSMATIEKTDVTITVVPEPSVALLFGSAGLALIAFARRQHR